MKTIIWDVDDVLNNLMYEWFDYWLHTHSECNIKYKDLFQNPPHNLLGISLKEYRISLDEFRQKHGAQFKPAPEVIEWFRLNGSKYRHMALTAVPLSLANISAEWVYRYFGNWIRSFNIVPSPRESDPKYQYDLSKKDFMYWLNMGDILVDDNLINITGADELGKQTIIFPRPWNDSKRSLSEALQSLNVII